MSIAATSSTTASSAANSSNALLGGSSAAQMANQFLTLLVTQMKNQDPMNPLDNAQVTSQLAQLSTVQGISSLNTTVNGLASQLQSSQVLQGAALIGQSVMAQGNVLSLGSSGAAGAVNLASAADTVNVNVLNSSGAVVDTVNLGQQAAGLAQFTWNGNDASGNALAQGNYTFQATATAAGAAVTTTPYSLQQVQSVSTSSSGLNAQLSNLGTVGLNQIIQIY